jgi:phage shock protein E
MLNLKKWLLNNKLIILGGIIGGILGFVYYSQIGCASGTCAITSDPYNSVIYFSLMGVLVMNIIKPNKENVKENEPK